MIQFHNNDSLRQLPGVPFRFRYRKELKLTGDYHVAVGRLEERHLYSVPYTYVGQKVTVLWDTEAVEIYQNNTRIALHRRCLTGGRTTEEAHMPENHLEYLHSKGRNAAFYLEEAASIGVYTWKAVEKVLASPKYITSLEKNDLIILDDFGLQPMDTNTRLALLQIQEERYERKSMIIASQLPISKWYDYIGDPTLADAIMDRLVANSNKIELKGESMRQRKKK